MPELIELREELTEITTLKYVSAAFLEAASARIVGIRKAFERNQEFYEEISQVYHTVKLSAEISKLKAQNKNDERKILKRRGEAEKMRSLADQKLSRSEGGRAKRKEHSA